MLAVPEDSAAAFRVRVPFWSVADAVGQMRRLLAETGDDEAELEAFFPAVAADAPERERRCRAAGASTFVAGLELAREGIVTLKQASSMGPIRMRHPKVFAANEGAL